MRQLREKSTQKPCIAAVLEGTIGLTYTSYNRIGLYLLYT